MDLPAMSDNCDSCSDLRTWPRICCGGKCCFRQYCVEDLNGDSSCTQPYTARLVSVSAEIRTTITVTSFRHLTISSSPTSSASYTSSLEGAPSTSSAKFVGISASPATLSAKVVAPIIVAALLLLVLGALFIWRCRKRRVNIDFPPLPVIDSEEFAPKPPEQTISGLEPKYVAELDGQ
ncbi:hypothetical protein BDD12DRAFT_346551 [Trichophaea hybrida]|nr:hypothetical protein BDD12DRAFT_346551 [Trichophaea hybrida]